MNGTKRDSAGDEPVINVIQDRGWAWVISISCAFINGITFGIYRSYGVIFFELLNTYGATREQASWPFSLCMTFTHLSGLIISLLNFFPLQSPLNSALNSPLDSILSIILYF